MEEMLTENFCDDCDNIVHAVFNEDDFYSFKVGRIRCPCGCVTVPCNECEEDACDTCPYANAEIKDCMTDEEYIKWLKENEQEMYNVYKNGSNGSCYKEIIDKLENE